jgi:hypothetical protein
MGMLSHRLQILLDDTRYHNVAREAARRGVSIAALIREALDQLPTGSEARRAAVDAILASEPMPVPLDPHDLRRELDAAHDRLHE